MGENFQPNPESGVIFKKVSVSVSKNLVLKKVSVLVSKKLVLNKKCRSRSQKIGSKKSLGIGLKNIWSQKSQSQKRQVSVSITFGLEKKSQYWSQKYLV